jgi:hypothetical protein
MMIVKKKSIKRKSAKFLLVVQPQKSELVTLEITIIITSTQRAYSAREYLATSDHTGNKILRA